MSKRLYNPVGIPLELKKVPRWVCWRADRKPDGRIDKLPLDKHNPNRKVNSLSNCESWDDVAVKAFRVPGLGLGFYPDSDHTGLVGIDLDHVFDGPIVKLQALEICEALDSYTEYSPSGTGLHIWIRSKVSPANRNGKVLEVKSKGNSYLTVTGNVYGKRKPIQERTKALQEILDKYFPKETPQERRDRIFLSVDDDVILRKLWAVPERVRLWEGDLSAYGGDHSRADLALCNYIYLFSNDDLSAVDRLFRRSGLMRKKWDAVHYSDGTTYGQRTLQMVRKGAKWQK